MSRITIVGSSPTLPITSVSPAGIAASHLTSPALAGVPAGLEDADGLADGLAAALDVTMGCAVGRGEVLVAEGEIEQAAHASNIAAAAYLKSTR
jgi:hypothetical protein